MKKIIILFLMAGLAEVYAKELDAEIVETKTYTGLTFDHFDKYDGTNWTVTARMTATDGDVKRITHEVMQAELVTKLTENTSVKQSEVEEILEWLRVSIEGVVEDAQ